MRFQHAHALGPEAPYIERRCDRELFERLSAGAHCHVLAPRQVGKSSLVRRTLRRLREASGAAPAYFVVSAIGTSSLTPHEWCRELATQVAEAVGLGRRGAVAREEGESPLAALRRELEAIARELRPRRLLLALDEVDVFREMTFGRDVLRMLHALVREASEAPITLCFIGSLRPELIAGGDGAQWTPFAAMHRVSVEDFTRGDLALFEALLEEAGQPEAPRLLEAVFKETRGHPAMTQQLCGMLLDPWAQEPDAAREGATPAERVAAQVEAAFFTSAHRDQLLLDMEKRLEAPDDPLAGPMLSRYHDLLVAGGKRESPPRSADDPVLDALSVVGLVRRTSTEEEVRNPIFARAFDLEWVERRLHRRRAFGPEMARWLRAGRPTHLLLREKQIEDALRWRDGRRDVAWEENDFIDRSLAHSLASRRRKLATWTVALGASIALAWGVAVAYTARLTTILLREANADREVAVARAERAAADSRLAEWERIHNITEACDNAIVALHRREGELVDAGALVDALGSRLAASNAQARALDASLGECRDELTDAGARIATLGGELTGCNGRLVDAGARITALGGELTGCNDQLADAGARVDALDHALRACEGALADASAAATALRAQAQQLDAAAAVCREQLEDAGAALRQCAARCPAPPPPPPPPPANPG